MRNCAGFHVAGLNGDCLTTVRRLSGAHAGIVAHGVVATCVNSAIAGGLELNFLGRIIQRVHVCYGFTQLVSPLKRYATPLDFVQFVNV